jgi:hypothetical protein
MRLPVVYDILLNYHWPCVLSEGAILFLMPKSAVFSYWF